MNTSAPLPTLVPPLPFLAELEGYIPGEQPTGPGYIKLNTNEFPYPAAPAVLEAIRHEANDLVRVYPNPSCAPLREALAARHGVAPENILVGNGSDEILRYLAHSMLAPGRTLAVVKPTYTLYQVLAAMFGAQVAVHALENDEHLPASLFAGGWSACFLPVPNPPLGTLWAGEELLKLASTGGLLVLDGAYVDFIQHAAGAPREPLPIAETLAAHPNIVFTRTFSKSFGLAGMRVGYIIACPAFIDELHKLRDSYNVNRISQVAALAAVQSEVYYRTKCDELIASRASLTAGLTALGFSVHASQGNFVFARHARAAELYEALKQRKILVRYFNHSGLQNGLRITLGTPDENAALLVALRELI
jgi:histidinol-phosphate aminotransferase